MLLEIIYTRQTIVGDVTSQKRLYRRQIVDWYGESSTWVSELLSENEGKAL